MDLNLARFLLLFPAFGRAIEWPVVPQFRLQTREGRTSPSLNLVAPGLLHLSSLRYPATLESPGSAILGAPVHRDEGPLDLRLFPVHPVSLRQSGLRHPWRSRATGRPFTGWSPTSVAPMASLESEASRATFIRFRLTRVPLAACDAPGTPSLSVLPFRMASS